MIRTDLAYAEPGGVPLRLDLYVPDGPPPPVCVYFHGGGWAVGARTAGAAERLVPMMERGIAVASVQYRFSDQATFPAQLEDARAAVRWVREHADDVGVLARRLGAWGASAGAHLASLLGLCPADEDSSVEAVVAWFPPTDLLARETDEPEGPRPPFLPDPLPTPSFEARLLGLESVRDDPARAREASPLTYAAPGAPPFLLMHGDRDGLVPSSHSRRLHEALLASGADSTLLLLAGANHEDPLFDGAASLGAVSGFLHDKLAVS
jgi:acetyl esterase/lipase